jgi:cytochrome c553
VGDDDEVRSPSGFGRRCVHVLERAPVASLPVAAAAVLAAGALAGTTGVTVTISDSSVKLSRASAPTGTVAYTVKDTGKKSYTFAINSKKSPVVKPGKSAKLSVVFSKAGKFTWTVVEQGASKKRTGTFTVENPGDPANGKKLFVSSGCGSCHTLKAAGTKGTTGTNLDKAKPSYSKSIDRITNGGKGMAPFKAVLSTKQIQDLSVFIDNST